MSRRQELAAKRAVLVARSELQRRDLALSSGDITHSLRKVDAAVSATRRAATHPLLLAGVVAAVVVIVRPRRLLQGLTWGLSAAVALQRASALLRTGA
jgi:YqjK-like protein